jgi:hypothetical protein
MDWVKPLGLDEDALAGAFLGGFNDSVDQFVTEVGKTFCAFSISFGFGKDCVTFANVCKSVVKKCENIWRNFFTKAIACAEVLIDPYLHF